MKIDADRPLPATSPTSNEEPALVEPEVVVQVAADLARRRQHGVQVDAAVALQQVGAAAGSSSGSACGLQLAGDARRLLALLLHHTFSARRWRVDSASVSSSSTPNSSTRLVAGVAASSSSRCTPESGKGRRHRQRDEAEQQQAGAEGPPARCQPRPRPHRAAARRGPPGRPPTTAAAARCRRSGSPSTGPGSRCPTCARRSACRGILQADPGQADQHQLPLQLRRVDPAFEHVERRDETVRRVAGEIHAHGAVGLGPAPPARRPRRR